MESVADWSRLLPELLVEIAIRVPLVEDFMAFRGVCTAWRAAASKDKFRPPPVRVPLLMLAEKEDSHEREFYSLSKKKISMKLPLPELKGKKCIEARFGYFLTEVNSGEVTLFNPWSRVKMELPNFKTFPEYYEGYKCNPEYTFIRRAVLSANPSETSNFVLLVVVNMFLGFWRPGDENWTRIEWHHGAFVNITNYNRKFYAINYPGDIWVWDPDSETDPALARVILTVDIWLIAAKMTYLVESSEGDLLLITRDGHWPEVGHSYGVTNFRVFRLDVIKGECEEISGLHKDAIFIGDNAAISVPASELIKANCIYFTDDCISAYCPLEDGEECPFQEGDCIEAYCPNGGLKGGGKDTGIYNIEDGRIERFDLESLSPICPPLWIAPSF